MKKVLIFITISLVLISFLGFISAINALRITASAVNNGSADDNEDDETNDEKVCCSTLVIVPDAVPSYEWRDAKHCDNIGNNGEELVGANNMIVNESFCENQEDNNDDENDVEEDCEAWTCTKWNDCINETKTRNCIKVNNSCLEEQDMPKISKNCLEKEKVEGNKKLTDCPEECTCSGSTMKCTLASGREMTVTAGKSGNTIVQVKGINMSTSVTLYKDDEGKLYGVFAGNETREVKVLPDQIKEKIKEKIKARLQDENITLNESGTYEYDGKKQARLFFIIPIKVDVKAEVDSETGEITNIESDKWWSFLAKDEQD